MTISQPSLGRLLLKHRTARKWPIGKAAAKCGIGKGMLYRIECGDGMELRTLNKILKGYGLELSINWRRSHG